MKQEKLQEIGDRLKALMIRKGSGEGQEENTDSEGGYLVQNNLLPSILAPDFMAGTLYSRCRIFNLGKNNNRGARVPISAETSRNASGIRGGVRAYWVAEGYEKTDSAATFDIIDLPLNKAAVIIYVTDQLKADSALLAQYLSKTAQDAIQFLVDRAIVYGGGSNMNGIAGHAATGNVNISAPITAAELKDIYDKYYGGKNGVWVFSQDLWIEVGDLWNDGDAAPALPLTFEGGVAYLWGLPVIVSDVISDRGVVLGDFSQYVVVQKELTTAVSEELKYLEDESCFRFVLRINGSPYWKGPIVTWDGTTVHPFVMETAEVESSSSSSSESSSSNSSSSSSTESAGNVSSSTSSQSWYGSSSSSSSSKSVSSSSSSSSEEHSGSSSSSTSSTSTQSESSSSETEGNVSSSSSTQSSTSSGSSDSDE